MSKWDFFLGGTRWSAERKKGLHYPAHTTYMKYSLLLFVLVWYVTCATLKSHSYITYKNVLAQCRTSRRLQYLHARRCGSFETKKKRYRAGSWIWSGPAKIGHPYENGLLRPNWISQTNLAHLSWKWIGHELEPEDTILGIVPVSIVGKQMEKRKQVK